MLYVLKSDRNIYKQDQLFRKLGVMRAQPPRQEDLDTWGVAILQPDNPPEVDVYTALKTASEIDGMWYRDYDVRSYTNEERLQKAKQDREMAVKAIVVSTSSGKSFDGNEDSQNRMTRAIVGMNAEDSINWVLADNSIAAVSKAELQEALYLAGQKQSELWVIPYENVFA